MDRCAECGSIQEPGASCRQCFDALLAFEYEHPPAFGAVHHLTVASFYLRHPRGHSLDALDAWRGVLSDSLDATRTQRDILAVMAARFEGAKRVRERDAVKPTWRPDAWSMTIRSVAEARAEAVEQAVGSGRDDTCNRVKEIMR